MPCRLRPWLLVQLGSEITRRILPDRVLVTNKRVRLTRFGFLSHVRNRSPPTFMLSLAQGSASDLCLKAFGDALKAPCSIDCGHVFCVKYVLHVDLDPTAPTVQTPRDNAEEQDIRPWLERIAKFAKEGGDEQTLRTLID
ncbi:hypothetical protein MPER_06433, partial [Moniliophthora perniciosa FA553]